MVALGAVGNCEGKEGSEGDQEEARTDVMEGWRD